uniref:Histone acetyltransferase type B catalytic subunit n=2 Tax=Hirondellea gigas TaxID=1518452 RepID=A0A6A7FMJ8_9CRUS
MEICERLMGSGAAEEYIINANLALNFMLVREPEDMVDEEQYFGAEMTHQVYGEGEQIFGYRNLFIKLFITAGRLNMYCEVEHSGMYESSKPGELKPDEVIPPLANLVPPNTILGSKSTFVAMIRKEASFRPFGEQISRHTIQEGGEERVFEMYLSDESTPGFTDYFERVQMFAMFYVDAASYIDNTDEKWRYFLVFEKYKSSDGASLYALAGFSTVYEFYGYPEHIRPRISQMLVLPPFQMMGVGSALLQAIYNKYIDDPKVLTIAVEDPSEVFGKMRLVLNCRNCLELTAFGVQNIKSGLTKQHYDEARTKLKLNKDCVRNVYNVLRFRATDRNDPEDCKAFRLFIKNQLYAPFRRQDKEKAKMEKHHLSQEEISELLSFVPKEKRSEIIHQEYLDLKAKFSAIVEKLPK